MRLCVRKLRGSRVVGLGMVVASLAAIALSPWAGHAAAADARQATINVPTTLIPTAPYSLPVLRLKVLAPPTSFLNSVLPNVGAAQNQLVPLSEIPFYDQNQFTPPANLIGAFHGNEHLAAFADTNTGEAAVYPNLGDQTAVSAQNLPAFLQQASGLAQTAFASNGLLPKDSTHFVLRPALPLDGSVATPQGGASPTEAFLAYVPVARKVGRFPVEGPGSTAYMAFDAEGKVEGFMRNWKSATKFATVRETRSKARIAGLIAAQLAVSSGAGTTSQEWMIQ